MCSARESPMYLLTRSRRFGFPYGKVHGFPLVLRGPHFPTEIIAAHRVRCSVEVFWRRLLYHGPRNAWSGGVGPGGEGLGTVWGWVGATGGRTGAFPFSCAGIRGGEGGWIAEPGGFAPEGLLTFCSMALTFRAIWSSTSSLARDCTGGLACPLCAAVGSFSARRRCRRLSMESRRTSMSLDASQVGGEP